VAWRRRPLAASRKYQASSKLAAAALGEKKMLSIESEMKDRENPW
jgi:hypothetical protein